jgi:NAD-dependent deacetylase sirtuin 2
MELDTFCDEVSKSIKDIYNIDADAPKDSSAILCRSCQKPLVKPSTVLFGRSLPEAFWSRSEEDLPALDLLIVAGTSLLVAPANGLVYKAGMNTKRVVINLEPVGAELGIVCSAGGLGNNRDLFLQGKCDEIFLELIQELGWLDDLPVDTLPESSADLVRKTAREKD